MAKEVKVVKVGAVFKAITVRKGSGNKGDYHFVGINLKDGEYKDGKELVEKITILPIDSEIAEGEYLKITQLISVSKTQSNYKGKWYDNINIEASFIKANNSEIPKIEPPPSPMDDGQLPISDDGLPF